MILDTSAVIAILRDEMEAANFAHAVEASDSCHISAVSYVEAGAVIDTGRDPVASRQLDALLLEAGVAIEPVTASQAKIAREAYRDFGKGSRHRAKLNFGDCFAYALAKELDQPLLFKGNDFSYTDVESALE